MKTKVKAERLENLFNQAVLGLGVLFFIFVGLRIMFNF